MSSKSDFLLLHMLAWPVFFILLSFKPTTKFETKKEADNKEKDKSLYDLRKKEKKLEHE